MGYDWLVLSGFKKYLSTPRPIQKATVILFKNWLSENNVKIGFPIYLGQFSLKWAFLRNVKIDFRIFEFFGGGNF